MATYDEILALDNKLKTHQKYLQFLTIEIYKSKNKLYPSFMWKTYNEKNVPYSQRSRTSLSVPNIGTQKYGKINQFQRKCFVEQTTNKA